MIRFGIYIAKFDEKILNNKDYKGIKNSYVIGEVNLSAKRYQDQKTVGEICKARIIEEARKNNGKNGFKAEIHNWDKSVKDFAFIVIEDEKNKVDDRIRNILEWHNLGRPVSGPNKNEFFLFNNEKLKAVDIAKLIEICTKNPTDCARNDSWTFYDFQKEIIKQGKEKLETYGELLLYLFCRVGKSAISIQIAKEITKTNHILILTAFPNAKDSFKKYVVNHAEMLGYVFFDKDNLSEESLMKSEKCVVFLSTNALRVKTDLEDGEDNSDELESEEVLYERIELLRKAGQFDVLTVDETHNGISSPKTNRLISKTKEALGVKYIIHNSATPFNDFKSNRFSREQTIQVDFLTILQNNWISFPKLNIISLPFYEDEKLTVKTLKSTKGKHKLLYCSSSTKTCKDFVKAHKDYFESNGIKIEYVDNLKGSTVEDKINTFQEENNKTITVSCDKGHTGCTYPKCDCVILARDLSSAERLIQVMSRCLTPDEDGDKEEVYFYTIGTENKYRAVSELKRNNNAANNHQDTKAFEDALKTGKLSIKSTSFKEGEDLKEYEAPLEEVLQEVAEFSASLDSFEKEINVDVVNLTIEDVVKNFSTYTESGISKAVRSLLTLFKEQGKRKIKEVQSKDAGELCEQLKKRINEKGSKKDKGKVEEYTLEELLAAWFMNVLRSLNTWLLCQEIVKFEDIVEYVTKENQFSGKERDTFAILVSQNENLLKNFIIAHNEVFVKFEYKTLYEKSNMNLRKFLSKDFDIKVGDVGGGYPEDLAKKIVRMASVDWGKKNLKVAIYDDIYLEATKTILSNHNINDMSLYYICSNRKVGKLLRKAYSIPLDHILYLDDKDRLYRLYYVDREGTPHYINNMIFDLIIANPPYGKSSSLSRKIVNALLENKVAKEMVVLAPPKTFYGVLGYSKELKCVSSYLNKTCVFEDAAVETLFLDHIVSEKQNKYKEPSDFLLDEKHKVFRNAVIEYNKTHSNNVKLFGGNGVQKYEKSKYLDFEDSRLFEIPIYTPSPLNGVASQGESYEHNVLRKPINWEHREKGRGPGLLYFVNYSEYDNFSNWWYSAKKRREGGLINFMFDILFILYGGDPSLLKYVEVIPHLDWSRPWTDSEILKEIGLPEDFLGE